MSIFFSINYHTQWGENLVVLIEREKENLSFPLSTSDGENWYGTYNYNFKKEESITYKYAVVIEGNKVRVEQANSRELILNESSVYYCYDAWNDSKVNFLSHSSLFETLFPIRKEVEAVNSFNFQLVVYAPSLPPNYRLFLSGDLPCLGAWSEYKALPLNKEKNGTWALRCNIEAKEIHYKLLAKTAEVPFKTLWEQGDNRFLKLPTSTNNHQLNLEVIAPHFNVTPWRGAGVSIPVFSLRTNNSFGVGEFNDLTLLVDWAKKTRLSLIQILPVNDTTTTNTWLDSYPYKGVSVYALHPLYLHIPALGELPPKELKRYEQLRDLLNTKQTVDYESVLKYKREFIKIQFSYYGKQRLESEAFRLFFEENKKWLIPYTAFSILRAFFSTANFNKWKKLSRYDEKEIELFLNSSEAICREKELLFYTQFELFNQLKAASIYAKSHHISFKGDIPIGVNRYSVETWKEPQLFHENGQAGAPPDAFSTEGQNWGFPTYNWDEMAKDNYQWWRERLIHMSHFFDAYRIDHILGFFRIWEIPIHQKSGLMGQFYPSLPLSAKEIESFGISGNSEQWITPYITSELLANLYKEELALIEATFFEKGANERYHFKEFVDTPVKLQHFIDDNLKFKKHQASLEKLFTEVLFLEDKERKGFYHPRISVQSSYVFTCLSQEEQRNINRLYNDYFFARHTHFWREEAIKKLRPLTECTSMLVCGEDLGMIPESVPEVLQELNILSLEVTRMPKVLGEKFGNVYSYPYSSIATFSTHDMSTIRGWWEEDFEQSSLFYHKILEQSSPAPLHATGQVCLKIIENELQSNSILVVLLLSDWISLLNKYHLLKSDDEQINKPHIHAHYWNYRIPITLEELIRDEELNRVIRLLIRKHRSN